MGHQPPQGRSHAGTAEEVDARRAEAYRLRLRGLSYREIGTRMGVAHTTIAGWTRAESDATIMPLADELRKQQLARLDAMRVACMKVLERYHVTVSDGRVVYDDQSGERIEDDGPVLQAVDRLVKIEDRYAKLCGLDAPTQIETKIELRSDSVDSELQELANKLGVPSLVDVEQSNVDA